MLDAAIKTQLQTYLDKITHSVEIIASLDHSEKSQYAARNCCVVTAPFF